MNHKIFRAWYFVLWGPDGHDHEMTSMIQAVVVPSQTYASRHGHRGVY